MSKHSNDEYAGSAGLSGAGVGGAMPVCPTKGVLHSIIGADVSVQTAMRNAMAGGAVSAASLAARKPGQIGAPMAAAPAAAPVAAVPMPVARAPAQVQAQAVGAHRSGGSVVTYASGNEVVTLVEHVIPFSMTMPGTLASLQDGAAFKFMMPIPGDTTSHQAVLKNVRVLRGSSSCRMELGVYFGDLKPLFKLSLPSGATGREFHYVLPRAGDPACTKPHKVYELDGLFNPRHIRDYAKHNSVESLLREVSFNEDTGMASVFVDSAIGSVIIKNNVHSDAPVHKTTVGERVYFNILKQDVVSIAQQIYDQVISDETFQRTITDLKNFDVTLVPLNVSGSFLDVPELNIEDDATKAAELARGFTVNLTGEMTVLMVPRAAQAGACARP
jgi:hypothetical protein